MEIILAALLAGKTVLPAIDRSTLELQARAEALQTPSHSDDRQVARRATSPMTLDLDAVTTICRAAGQQADPARFIARISRAYALPADEAQSLRASCAAYLAGVADAAAGN
ncbi:MAG: hypothetical protein ACT4OE_03975 [Sphingosinicella sp.]